jgi:hypothetical protein
MLLNAKERMAKSLERCMQALVPAGNRSAAGRLGGEVSRHPPQNGKFFTPPHDKESQVII